MENVQNIKQFFFKYHTLQITATTPSNLVSITMALCFAIQWLFTRTGLFIFLAIQIQCLLNKIKVCSGQTFNNNASCCRVLLSFT